MLPTSNALAKFSKYTTFYMVVPAVSQSGRYWIHVTVLVKPQTPDLIRRDIRRALHTYFTPQVIFDAYVNDSRAKHVQHLDLRMVVHVKTDRNAQ